jgi:hypothetical protein
LQEVTTHHLQDLTGLRGPHDHAALAEKIHPHELPTDVLLTSLLCEVASHRASLVE